MSYKLTQSISQQEGMMNWPSLSVSRNDDELMNWPSLSVSRNAWWIDPGSIHHAFLLTDRLGQFINSSSFLLTDRLGQFIMHSCWLTDWVNSSIHHHSCWLIDWVNSRNDDELTQSISQQEWWWIDPVYQSAGMMMNWPSLSVSRNAWWIDPVYQSAGMIW
jgi:hypothetical protein